MNPHQKSAKRNSVICYATADWDAELWTNKQHMMNRLSARGIPVLYVDSPGHRSPTAGTTDARRMAHRLALWRPTARSAQPGLWRDSPLLVPNYNYPSVVRLNEHLLRRRLRRNELSLRLIDPILWTYTPVGATVYDRGRHAGLIYHCVDDVAAFPGVNAKYYRRAEEALARQADVCIGSSKHLVRHLQDLGATEVRYWPNPADTSAFNAARTQPKANSRQGRPLIGFLGAVQEHKVDTDLIKYCATMLPEADFIVAGPHGLGLGHSAINPSSFPKNVSFPGKIELDDAPALVATFDVAIIPYRVNGYTAGVFPMKVFEYLAAGLPVISTQLPSLVGEVEYVSIASDHSHFLSEVRRCINEPFSSAAAAARAQYASGFSWQRRVDEAVALIAEVRQRNSHTLHTRSAHP